MKVIKVSKGEKSEVVIESLSDLKVILEDNAELKVVSIQNANVKSNVKRVSNLGKNARLKWIDYWLNGSINLGSEDNLNGKNAAVKRVGIFFGSGKQEFNSDIVVNHNAPGTISEIITRGALDGKAKAKNLDMIRVKNGSKKSRGKQKADILLLSDNSFADASPRLEIEEEDVNCSHGAAIGRINSDKLFYLASRGLNEKDAKKQIITAFFEPVLKEIRDEDVVCALRGSVAKKIGGVK